MAFRWKDRANGGVPRTGTLPGVEFVRRYLRHVLPRGMKAIRYYGFSHPAAKAKREHLASATGCPPPAAPVGKPAAPARPCPCCGQPMVRLLPIPPAWRQPPPAPSVPPVPAARPPGRHPPRHPCPVMHLKPPAFPDKPANCLPTANPVGPRHAPVLPVWRKWPASRCSRSRKQPCHPLHSAILSGHRRSVPCGQPRAPASESHPGKHKPHKRRLTQSAGLVQPKGAVEGSFLTFAATFIVGIAIVLISHTEGGISRTTRRPQHSKHCPWH